MLKKLSIFHWVLIVVILGILGAASVFAVPPVHVTRPDGTDYSRVVSSSLTFINTTAQGSTADRTGDQRKGTFFVHYDETEHVGAIKTSHIKLGGDGWAVNDTFSIAGGTSNATFKVLTVASGAINVTQAIAQGLGYTVADDQAIEAISPSTGANATIDVTVIGAALSAAVTLQVSDDNSTWLGASFYDYAGGATLQTTETLSADGGYVFWTNQDIVAPYTKVVVTPTNTEAVDTIVTNITAVSN